MPTFDTSNPAVFAVVAAVVSVVGYVALAAAFGDSLRTAAVAIAGTAVGVGLATFYVRRSDTR